MEVPLACKADELEMGYRPKRLTDDLRRVLRTELLRGTCSAATVARIFSMHRRTLHRHLRLEGLDFRQVANEIRFEIACELLGRTDMALSQVAAVLRYSELSAFSRAFRRWSGQSPSVWRSNHLEVRRTRLLRRKRHLRANSHPSGNSG